ncbi:MAG: hypothetical protein NVSMB44_23280 [Ktedonobacteraceae bacterium]
MMSLHDPLNTRENRLPLESNKPRLAKNHDSRREDSSSQSTGDVVVTDRQPSLEIAQHVQAQDVQIDENGRASLIKGVAKDRRISIEDAEMRHGRKSRGVCVDGYKRHVLHDLDTGLIRAVGITPANIPEAGVMRDISTDLEQQEVSIKELHIDRGYLSNHLVHERSDELAIYRKAWPVRVR